MPLPALLEPYSFPAPVRTSVHDASPTARHSPGRPAGIRKVPTHLQSSSLSSRLLDRSAFKGEFRPIIHLLSTPV